MIRAGVVLALGASPLAAQGRAEWMARGVVALRHADPAPGGGTDTELRLSQPTASLDVALRRGLQFRATVNLESLTMPRGELTPGGWGEGYVDRRHPHTTVHELMLVGSDLLGRHDGAWEVGLAMGKGFAPFGTDDPMSRPFLSYPVNHHFAQVLERAVAVAQVRRGAFLVEAAVFNGDEPERPGQWPLIRHDGTWRFGDSWSARFTATPRRGLELQASAARVHSPEHRPGAGGVHRKRSVAVRWDHQDPTGRRYLLAEWARNDELEGTFVFHSALLEGAVRRGRFGAAYRFERTERPEEHRLTDPYRTQRPHLENSILGVLRWSLHTLQLDLELAPTGTPVRVRPFVEVTLGRVAKVGGGIADPATIYGGDRVRHLTVGIVLERTRHEHRMGRYGLAAPDRHH